MNAVDVGLLEDTHDGFEAHCSHHSRVRCTGTDLDLYAVATVAGED